MPKDQDLDRDKRMALRRIVWGICVRERLAFYAGASLILGGAQWLQHGDWFAGLVGVMVGAVMFAVLELIGRALTR